MKNLEARSDPAPSGSEAAAFYETVSLPQRLGLGCGGIADMGLQYGLMTMAGPIFNVALGVNPVLIGVALSLPRFWEMFFDPWIGTRSDRTRSRLGRRHPYIILGAIASGFTFASIWWVPAAWSPLAKGVWLIAFALLHFTAYSIFIVPYSALLAEISPNRLERMRIMATRTAFTALASCGISWLYWLCQRPVFHGAAPGMRVVGAGFGLLLAAAAVVPTLVCPRNRLFRPAPAQEKTARESFVLREILGIREFRCIVFAVLGVLASFTLVSNLTFYINIYYVFRGDTAAASVLQGVAALIVCATSMTTCYVVSFCARRIGRATTLKLFLLLTLAGKISTWWTYSPRWPYATIVSITLINMGITAFWIFMPALIGEISRRLEARTGQSLYGSFCAMYGVAMKVATSLSLLLTGFILNFTHFNVALGKMQSADTLLEIRVLNIVLPVAGLLLAFSFLRGVWPAEESAAAAPQD